MYQFIYLFLNFSTEIGPNKKRRAKLYKTHTQYSYCDCIKIVVILGDNRYNFYMLPFKTNHSIISILKQNKFKIINKFIVRDLTHCNHLNPLTNLVIPFISTKNTKIHCNHLNPLTNLVIPFISTKNKKIHCNHLSTNLIRSKFMHHSKLSTLTHSQIKPTSPNLSNTNLELVMAFYSRVVQAGGRLLLAKNKKPFYEEIDPRGEIVGTSQLKEVLISGVFDIRIDFKAPAEILCLDFDLYKNSELTQDNLTTISSKIQAFLRALDTDIVVSPSGGFHAYFSQTSPAKLPNKIDMSCKYGIPNLDYLGTTGGTIGPNLSNRPLINLRSGEGFATLPQGLEPAYKEASKASRRKLFSKYMPDEWPHCFNKGTRRRTGLALFRMFGLSIQSLKDLNDFFFEPPKSTSEFEEEVLSKLDGIERVRTTKTQATLCYEEIDTSILLNDIQSGTLYIYLDDEFLWVQCDYNFLLDHFGLNSPQIEIDQRNLLAYVNRKARGDLAVLKKSYLVAKKLDNAFAFKDGAFGLVTETTGYKLIQLPQEDIRDAYLMTRLPISSTEWLKSQESNTKMDLTQILDNLLAKIPSTVKILADIIDFKSNSLTRHYLRMLMALVITVFLRSNNLADQLNLQKLVVFQGFGGTGKSTLINWIQSFTNQGDVAAADLDKISGRFEKTNFVGRSLILLNEVAFPSGENISSTNLSNIFSLTGNDLQRGEKKYQDIFSFFVDAVVIISSNFSIQTRSVENYGALRRRLLTITCDRFIPANQRKSMTDIQELLAGDSIRIKETAYTLMNRKNEIIELLEGFDSEDLIIDSKEHGKYERCTDPYYSFLKEVIVERSPSDLSSPISFNQLWCFYLQYLYSRKNSTFNINDYSEYKHWISTELGKSMPNLDPMGATKSFKAKKALPGIGWLDPIFNEFTQKFEQVLASRVRLSSHLPMPKVDRLFIREPELRYDKVTKTQEEVVVVRRTNMVMNWVINLDAINQGIELPSFNVDYCTNTEELKAKNWKPLRILYSTDKKPKSVALAKTTTNNYKETTKLLELKDKIKNLESLKQKDNKIKSELNKTRAHLRYYLNKYSDNKNLPRRHFCTKHKESILDNTKEEIKMTIRSHFSRTTEDLDFWKKCLIMLNTKNIKNNNKTRFDHQLLIEQKWQQNFSEKEQRWRIVKNPKSIVNQQQKEFIEELKEYFPNPLANFIWTEMMNAIYHQTTQFPNLSSTKTSLKLVLNPFVDYIWGSLHEDRYHYLIKPYLIENLDSLKSQEVSLLERRIKIKEEKSHTSSTIYKSQLAEVNKELRKLRDQKSKKAEMSTRDLVIQITTDTLNCFYHLGYFHQLEVFNKFNKIRIVNFPGWYFKEIFKIVQELKKYPMVIPPKEWQLIDETPKGGGYLTNSTIPIQLLMKSKKHLVTNIVWNNDYIKTINKLQVQPQKFSLLYIKDYIVGKITKNLEDLEQRYKEKDLYTWGNDEHKSTINFINHKIRALKDQVKKLIETVIDLQSLVMGKETDLILYFPLHVDQSLRLYNSGALNPILNKLLRMLSIPHENSNLINSTSCDLFKRFYLTVQLYKVDSLHKVLSREELLNTTEVTYESTRDWGKFNFFLRKYKNNNEFNIAVDATASVLQIYSLIFGDIELAKWTNLLGGNYSDVYLKIKDQIPLPKDWKDWTTNMKNVYNNRSFLKNEITFYLYGSVILTGIKGAINIQPQLSPSEAKKIVLHVREFLDKRFSIAFDYKNLVKRIISENILNEKAGLTWNFQDNICSYKALKIVKQKVRINTLLLDKDNNRFEVKNVSSHIDKLKMERLILTTLIHSSDAEVITNLRLLLWERHKISVITIHDAIVIPPQAYRIVCLEYKKILKSIIFNKKLSNKIIVPKYLTPDLTILLEKFERRINEAKTNPEWSKLVLDEGYPLYPE